MKRILSKVFVLIVVLAMMTSPVFAGSALELVDVAYTDSGPTFYFRVVGDFSKSELNSGFVQVEGGDDYPLYCAQQDADTVVCHTTKQVAGASVVVGFGGARFWTQVPTGHCYDVWDWSYPEVDNGWENFTTHCQGSEAQYLDEVFLYNPTWDGSFYYYYYPFDAPAAFCAGDVTSPAGGYYFTSCPTEVP
jgi:hypothetical protein